MADMALFKRSTTPPAGFAEFDRGRPQWMVNGGDARLHDVEYDLTGEVVGESRREQEIRKILAAYGEAEGGGWVAAYRHALLVPEIGNPHDDKAIAVWVDGLLVGYIPRDEAQTARPSIEAAIRQHGKAFAVECRVLGKDYVSVRLEDHARSGH